MRNLKRTLSLVMAAAMLIGMMVVSASAASSTDFTDADEIEHTEAVNTMVALNVIDGKEDGSYYDPTGTLTRAEMAKIVAFVMNGGVEPNIGTKVVPTYADIDDHWAEAYIEYCTSMGIINGDGAGNFNPGGTLTASQAAKMFLTAIGYNANVFGLVGNDWETNTNRYANEAGLYENLGNVSVSAPISRDDAAQMAYNAIQATLMVRSWSQDMTTGEITEGYALSEDPNSDTLLETRFNAVMEYGYITGVDYNEDRDEYTYDLSNDDFNGGEITTDAVSVDHLTTDLDVSSLYGQKVKVIYQDNSAHDVYGIYPYESSVLTSAVIGDLPDDLDDASSMSVNDVTYRFDGNSGNTPVYAYLAGELSDVTSLNGLAAVISAHDLYKEWNVDLIDNDGDNRVNLVMVYPFTVAQVSYVGTDSFNTAANAIMGVSADTGIDFDDVTVYDGIARDDYVKIVAGVNTVDGKDAYTLIEDVVEGEIDALRTSELRVDGTWYSFDEANFTSYDVGDSYTFVIVNGYICANDALTTGADLSDYALVVNAVASGSNGMLGDQARLMFTDGSTEVVDTAHNYSGNYNPEADFDEDTTDFALVGALVTYEIEDGEYVLTPASSNADDAGFDMVVSGSYVYASNGRSTIGGEYIADDAVVFVLDDSGDYDVISGSSLRRYTTASVTTVTNAYADQASNGFNNVVLAYVTLADDVARSTSTYGYVTSNLTTTRNDDGDRVSQLSIWTADGLLEDILADEELDDVARGSIVTYEINDDGSYTINLASSINRSAILAYNSSNGDIRFTDSSLSSSGSNRTMEITGDTVILYINSDSHSGVEGDESLIVTAVETATDNLYQANAYYYSSTGTELDLLVVDTYGDLPVMPGN